MNPDETHPATAPAEIWNRYNNDVKKDKAWLTAVKAAGINAEVLRNWHTQSAAWQEGARVLLGLCLALAIAA